MLDQEDEGTRIGVWVVLGVVFFVLTGVIGGLALRQLQAGKAAAPPVAAAAAAGDELVDAPLTGELLGKLYFELGQATLPSDAAATLSAAAKALADAPGKRLVLSGFHDTSGDPAKNAELAKQRAIAVREALKVAGAEAARLALRKPESTAGGTDAQEARRVELRLVD